MRSLSLAPPTVGIGSACGTFGELLQGQLTGHQDFLVTLPVARWARARFEPESSLDRVVVTPPHKAKSRLVASMMLQDHGWSGGGRLTLTGTLQEGKGMASSSADLTATARAVAQAFHIPMSPAAIENYLRQVEPTDGVMHPGVVSYLYREVRLIRPLGFLPALTIVSLDQGGGVDTVKFNSRDKLYPPGARQRYDELLDALSSAIACSDLRTLGAVATESARMNEAHHHKLHLEAALEITADTNALGVVAAHSGTLLGVLLDPREVGYRQRLIDVQQACGQIATTFTITTLVGRRSHLVNEQGPIT